MPLFAVICKDKPDHLHVRTAKRADHLAYLEATDAVLAGPFLDETGSMTGSMVVVEAANLAAAQGWAKGDPYAKADLFAKVEIKEWKRVIG